MVTRYGFPKEEPQFYTELTLSEYQRPRPSSSTVSNTKLYARLPMPDQLTDSYNMELNTPQLGLAGMVNMNIPSPSDMLTAGKSFLSDVPGSVKSMMSSVSNYMERVAPGAYDTLKNGNPAGIIALTPGLSETQWGKAAQAQTGMVRNPHVTTVFEGVRLRDFTFTWKLSPKSRAEADEMATMINDIKKYMHPELVYSDFAFNYPYMAEVNFVGGSTSNSTLPKVSKSFISGMSINNLTSGVPTFYTDGRPVTIDITIQFNEISIKSRRDFN